METLNSLSRATVYFESLQLSSFLAVHSGQLTLNSRPSHLQVIKMESFLQLELTKIKTAVKKRKLNTKCWPVMYLPRKSESMWYWIAICSKMLNFVVKVKESCHNSILRSEHVTNLSSIKRIKNESLLFWLQMFAAYHMLHMSHFHHMKCIYRSFMILSLYRLGRTRILEHLKRLFSIQLSHLNRYNRFWPIFIAIRKIKNDFII